MDCLITLFEWNERNRLEIAAHFQVKWTALLCKAIIYNLEVCLYCVSYCLQFMSSQTIKRAASSVHNPSKCLLTKIMLVNFTINYTIMAGNTLN